MISRSRPSIFGEDIDLTGFTPKSDLKTPSVSSETVRKVSEEGGFPSRSPTLTPVPAKRPVLVRSGRTVLLNAHITQRAHDDFHEIVEAQRRRYEQGEIMHRPTLGEIVERALAALKREIEQNSDLKL